MLLEVHFQDYFYQGIVSSKLWQAAWLGGGAGGGDKKHMAWRKKTCCSVQVAFSRDFPPAKRSLNFLLYPLDIQAEAV